MLKIHVGVGVCTEKMEPNRCNFSQRIWVFSFSTFFVCSEKLHKPLPDDVNSWKKEEVPAGTCFS